MQLRTGEFHNNYMQSIIILISVYIHTAVPLAPTHEQITCNCDKYQQACITVLKVEINKADMITQNQDTSDINLINIAVLGGDIQQLPISLNTDTESDLIIANFTDTKCVGEEHFHVNTTLIDKCGQQSSPVVIECKPCETRGTYNNYYVKK
jgi:hypothetical protein